MDARLDARADARATRADPRIARLDPSATPTRAEDAQERLDIARGATDGRGGGGSEATKRRSVRGAASVSARRGVPRASSTAINQHVVLHRTHVAVPANPIRVPMR